MARAVVMLSAGQDSTTLFYYVAKVLNYEEIYAISFDYSQRHIIELQQAREIWKQAKPDMPLQLKEHKVVNIDLRQFGGSPLTDKSIAVPAASEKKQTKTVVPARNTILISLAAAYAGTIGRADVFHGANRDDFKSYPDCRPAYINSISQALTLSGEVTGVFAPFNEFSKTDIVAIGRELKVPWELTHSCYNGKRPACGLCDACVERVTAFKNNAMKDPIDYEIEIEWDEIEQ